MPRMKHLLPVALLALAACSSSEPVRPAPPVEEPRPVAAPDPEPAPVVQKPAPLPEPPKRDPWIPPPPPGRPSPLQIPPPETAKPAVAAAPEPAKPPPPEDPAVRVKKATAEASDAIREASGTYQELAAAMEKLPQEKSEIEDLIRKADLVKEKLLHARRLYVGLRTESPDPAAVDRRLSALDELLSSVGECLGRLRPALATARETPAHVKKLMVEAAEIIRVARPTYQEVTSRYDFPKLEKAVVEDLIRKSELLQQKFREAVRLYKEARPDAPDRRLVDTRVSQIEDLSAAIRDCEKDLRARLK